MDINGKLKKIDSFFDKLSVEEFEQIAIRCGIDEIKPLSDYELEMAASNGNNYTSQDSFRFNEFCQYNKFDSVLIEAA